MTTRLDQTIVELENIVAEHMGAAGYAPNPGSPPWVLDLLFLMPANLRTVGRPLSFDDVWITVWAGAPQREALQKAGLTISPMGNRDENRGTASVTAEFQNAFLELTWLEPPERLPRAQPAVENYHLRNEWRLSGRHAGWLPAGSTIEIPAARDESQGLPFLLRPRTQVAGPKPNAQGAHRSELSSHPLGVKRVTAVRLFAQSLHQPVPSLELLERSSVIGLRSGMHWAVEITFDGGLKLNTTDLRPALPVVLKY